MSRIRYLAGIAAAAAVVAVGWRLGLAQSPDGAKATFIARHQAVPQAAAQTPPPASLPLPGNPHATPAPARIVWEPNSPAPVPAHAEILGLNYGAPGQYSVSNYLITPDGPTIFARALGSRSSRGFVAVENAYQNLKRSSYCPWGVGGRN